MVGLCGTVGPRWIGAAGSTVVREHSIGRFRVSQGFGEEVMIDAFIVRGVYHGSAGMLSGAGRQPGRRTVTGLGVAPGSGGASSWPVRLMAVLIVVVPRREEAGRMARGSGRASRGGLTGRVALGDGRGGGYTGGLVHSRSAGLRIPVQTDHRFRSKPITDSGPNRSPIPVQTDHPRSELSGAGRPRRP